ncbi:MAG: hypothetical protein ABIQ51_04155 [Mesorhizobium sp.]
MADSKVQIGKMMHGRDDDGVDQFTPIYAYCEETIERNYADLRHMLFMFGRGGNEDAIRARSAARLAEKLADFRKQESDYEQAQAAAGITAARQATELIAALRL